MKKTRSLRVAVVHADVLPIPPVLGGAIGQIVYETVLGLPEIDWTIISRWDDALTDVSLDDRFHYVDIDARLKKVQDTFKGQPQTLTSDVALRRFCYVDGACDILEQCEVDIIQVENRPQFLPYLKKRFPQKKFILYLHNEADFSDPRVVQGLRLCDRAVFVSHFLKRVYLARFPKLAEKAIVVYNGVEARVWNLAESGKKKTDVLRTQYRLSQGQTLLFVGRTTPEKGVHCLLKAMSRVLEKMPDVKLMIVGSPFFGARHQSPYMERLKKRALALGHSVIFTGFVDREDLAYYYACADLVVVPSLFSDPLPTVVLEALASGTPVLGSGQGGIPEMVVDQKTGALVDNVKQDRVLARKIVELLRKPQRLCEMGRLASKHVKKNFSLHKRWQNLDEIYSSVVGNI